MGRKRRTDLELPNCVYLEHGAYYYRAGKKPRVRLTRNRDEISEAMRRAGLEPTQMHVGHISTVFWHCRKNAKSRAIPCEITKDHVLEMWRRSGGRCELTGLKFDLINGIGFRRRPFAPSIDRIDNRLGYTSENCRLIIVALNLAMNEWGEGVFRQVARAYLRQSVDRFPTVGNSDHRENLSICA